MKALLFIAKFSPVSGLWLRQALPNAVTLLAMFFGLTGLLYASQHEFVSAIACVLISAVLDACDGRVARATGTASKFGAELDSLSDVVCFGAVPAFLLYMWGLESYHLSGWLMCLLFAGASALRLARFNVTAAATDQRSWAGHFFSGIPAPGGAFLAMSPIYLANASVMTEAAATQFAFCFVPFVAGLMVSTWPTFSAKAISRKALRLLFIPSLIVAYFILFGIATAPWFTLSVCAFLYVFTLPLSKMRYNIYLRRNA